mgnify:FL=1
MFSCNQRFCDSCEQMIQLYLSAFQQYRLVENYPLMHRVIKRYDRLTHFMYRNQQSESRSCPLKETLNDLLNVNKL